MKQLSEAERTEENIKSFQCRLVVLEYLMRRSPRGRHNKGYLPKIRQEMVNNIVPGMESF